jgi:hypothetical protein
MTVPPNLVIGAMLDVAGLAGYVYLLRLSFPGKRAGRPPAAVKPAVVSWLAGAFSAGALAWGLQRILDPGFLRYRAIVTAQGTVPPVPAALGYSSRGTDFSAALLFAGMACIIAWLHARPPHDPAPRPGGPVMPLSIVVVGIAFVENRTRHAWEGLGKPPMPHLWASSRHLDAVLILVILVALVWERVVRWRRKHQTGAAM